MRKDRDKPEEELKKVLEKVENSDGPVTFIRFVFHWIHGNVEGE